MLISKPDCAYSAEVLFSPSDFRGFGSWGDVLLMDEQERGGFTCQVQDGEDEAAPAPPQTNKPPRKP